MFSYPTRWATGLAVLCVASVVRQAEGQRPSKQQSPFADSAKLDSSAIARLLNLSMFGVPTSPAFELLPGRPSQVVHLATPTDFAGHLSSWTDGTHLLTGAAFDLRPLAAAAGPLSDYGQHQIRQVAWRSVLSVGTVAATDNAKDVIAAAGLRLPLADGADPRSDAAYVDTLERLYVRVRDSVLCGPPPNGQCQPQVGMTANILRQADSIASAATQAVRTQFQTKHWNALKVDIGLAGSVRVLNGITSRDSVQTNQAGLWSAVARGIGPDVELTASGKATLMRTDSSSQERRRFTAGALAEIFPTKRWSVAGEYAHVWSRYATQQLNEGWSHFAIVTEIEVSATTGWLGLGYGGDTAHRGSRRQVSFQYSIYKNRIMTTSQ